MLMRPTQSPPDHICLLISVVSDQFLRKTYPPSQLLSKNHLRPLVASLDLGAQLRYTPRLYPSSSTTTHNSNLHFLQPCHHTAPFVQLCCRAVPPTHIVHVIVHYSIFPCFIAHITLYSMPSGGGSRSPYAKHHYRGSKRDNDTWRFVLHSAHMG